jgi:hypothetical protein
MAMFREFNPTDTIIYSLKESSATAGESRHFSCRIALSLTLTRFLFSSLLLGILSDSILKSRSCFGTDVHNPFVFIISLPVFFSLEDDSGGSDMSCQACPKVEMVMSSVTILYDSGLHGVFNGDSSSLKSVCARASISCLCQSCFVGGSGFFRQEFKGGSTRCQI